MRVNGLLHKMFVLASVAIDKRIHATLLLAVGALLEFKHLSVTGIGRTLSTTTAVKHAIKRIDRLFSNEQLKKNLINYYSNMASWLLQCNANPIIIIDWSGLTKCGQFHFLAASTPVGGRALPLLKMAFPLDEYGSPAAHRRFVRCLKSMLPRNCRPIIVTDAGFRCPWFKLIKSMSWDFVGRVRHETYFSISQGESWYKVKMLYSRAKLSPSYLFDGLLATSNPVHCSFYLVKQRKKNRIKKNLAGKKIQCSVSKKHEKRGNEPWLIVSSLSPQQLQPHQLIGIYSKRMQIEESFRDLKNTKNGLGLRHCRSYTLDRLNVALLIGSMAFWVLWIIGYMARLKGVHWQLQTNTVRNRNVMSNFAIGWQIVRRNHFYWSNKLFLKAIKEIAACTVTH